MGFVRHDRDYEDLNDLAIDWAGFSFSGYYRDETRVLKPQLERLGFKDVYFGMGERDSFGPLSRIVHATDKDGKRRFFVYG